MYVIIFLTWNLNMFNDVKNHCCISTVRTLMTNIWTSHTFIWIINNTIIDLPAPSNISSWWNFGSLFSICLVLQILTGLFLAISYTSDKITVFSSITHIGRDVNYGWIIWYLQVNGASMFFICLYINVGRDLYYGSYTFLETWNVGVILLLTVIATAFIGYILPWGQISLWRAIVITNLLSAIPYIGTYLVKWIWGGFSVDKATLHDYLPSTLSFHISLQP